MPTMKLHCAPLRATYARPPRMPAITTSTASASSSPVVRVMMSLPMASENWVAPRPRKKDQLLPATKSTELTNDRPAIQMSQLAPDRTSWVWLAISMTAGDGPAGPGGVVLGVPVVLTERVNWGPHCYLPGWLPSGSVKSMEQRGASEPPTPAV